MEKLKVTATCFLATGILALALALVYFTYSFTRSLPEISAIVRDMNEAVEPITVQAEAITDQLPDILAEIQATREQVPAILAEVEAIRETVPLMLAEWEATRTETIPAVLAEVEATRTDTVPALLAESEAIRGNLPALLEESVAYRELGTSALAESERVRILAPTILDRLDNIVTESKTIASTAGEGAVTGVFTGILKAPFRLVGSVGDAILPDLELLNESERALMRESIENFVNVAAVGESTTYASEDNRFSGSVTILADFLRQGNLCREISFAYRKNRTAVPDQAITVCVDDDGVWSVAEN